MIRNKRIGRFLMTDDFINKYLAIATTIMGKCVPIKTERIAPDVTCYTAISDEFDEVPDGITPYEYIVRVQKESPNNFKITFERYDLSVKR